MKKMSIVERYSRASLKRPIEFLTEKLYATIVFPEDTKSGIEDIIGLENEKETLSDVSLFFKNTDYYQKYPHLCPNRYYLISSAVFDLHTELFEAIAKDANVPIITIASSAFNAIKPGNLLKSVNTIFKVADSFESGCIVNFEEFSATLSLNETVISNFLAQLTKCLKESPKTVVFLSTFNKTIEVPAILVKSNLFNVKKVVEFTPPTLEEREKLVANYFKTYCLPKNNELVKRVARNTLGMYPKQLEYVVRETRLYAARNEISEITFKEFNNILISFTAGEKCYKLSEKERIATAYHEAGHVVAAYYSNPDYILGRVEITPRSESLGLTMEELGEDKYSQFYHEIRNMIIYSYGGMAAEKLIYDETTSGTVADIAAATSYALFMFSKFGMSPEIGPVLIDDEEGLFSEKINNDLDNAVQVFLKAMFDETFKIVSEHKHQLEALAHALIMHEVLIGDEIKNVLDNA